jgi:hypothetical protein
MDLSACVTACRRRAVSRRTLYLTLLWTGYFTISGPDIAGYNEI